jgi:hypothetical protein
MDRFACAFSKEQNAHGTPLGLTRIGVHTGSAVIGNFGSRTRHNYTASGDAVNTASRLEGLNKHFGTRLSVSGATQALCAQPGLRPMASVVLKGKTSAIEVWEALQESERPAGFVARYCEAYAMLKDGAPGAGALFEALALEFPGDPCVAFHLARIHRSLTGVTVVMTEK